MKTFVKRMLYVTAVAAMLLGCTKKEAVAPQASETKTDGFTVGYCINNLNDTFQTYILEAAKTAITEAGGQIEVNDATEDTIKQQDQVNSFIAKGVKGLIVVPVDTSSMDAITNAARNAGIPLCYVNRNPFAGKEDSMPDGVYYVGSQEIVAGRLQGERVGELLQGKGGVAILVGILGNEGALKRTEGNKEVLASKYPEITVLAEQTKSKVYLVHRLDKDTAGLLITAKNPAAASKWTNLIASKAVTKEYYAVCAGSFLKRSGTIDSAVEYKKKQKGS